MKYRLWWIEGPNGTRYVDVKDVVQMVQGLILEGVERERAAKMTGEFLDGARELGGQVVTAMAKIQEEEEEE